jgi:hypothetical protein
MNSSRTYSTTNGESNGKMKSQKLYKEPSHSKLITSSLITLETEWPFQGR